MDGERIREYFSREVQALVDIYKQFEILLPNDSKGGSYHPAEEGSYVESLIKELLKKFLPKELEVLSGFILKPAVKIGKKDYKSRKNKKDYTSSQLDIIVYDSAHFPIFQRFENNVIVPPEGVIAVISVKKILNPININGDKKHPGELEKLIEISKICQSETNIVGPFLGLISIDSNINNKKRTKNYETIFKAIKKVYAKHNDLSDENIIGYIGALKKYSIFKTKPNQDGKDLQLLFTEHQALNEIHLGIQLLLNGILKVYYDSTRCGISRPGFTAFPSDMIKSSEMVLKLTLK